MGLALHNLKVPAVPVVLHGCVVAQENPQALLHQVATSLFFYFLAAMLLAAGCEPSPIKHLTPLLPSIVHCLDRPLSHDR
jgi:hypothetical protein